MVHKQETVMAKMTFRRYWRMYWFKSSLCTLFAFISLPWAVGSGKFMNLLCTQLVVFILLNLILLAVARHDWKRFIQ